MGYRITCFGGRLMHGTSGWRWDDGVAEPLVCDIPAQLADLVWSKQEHHDAIEIPIDLIEVFDPLASSIQAGMFGVSRVESKHAPGDFASPNNAWAREQLLVPRLVWQHWCTMCPILPVWSPADDAQLRERAIEHGWEGSRLGSVMIVK